MNIIALSVTCDPPARDGTPASDRRTRGERLADDDPCTTSSGTACACGPSRRPRPAAAMAGAADAGGCDRCGKARRVKPLACKRGRDGRLLPKHPPGPATRAVRCAHAQAHKPPRILTNPRRQPQPEAA